MFLNRKRLMLLHLGGKVIRTTADHTFYVQGKGWTAVDKLRPGDLLGTQDGQDVPVEAVTASDDEQVVYNLPLPQVSPMLPRTIFSRPIIGFVSGTPILTPNGAVPIEQIRPGDTRPFAPQPE